MATRRSGRSPTAKRKPAKSKRARSPADKEALAGLLGLGKVIGNAYGFVRFPIRENQSWSNAKWDAEFNKELWIRFADCFPGGVIAGFEDDDAQDYFARRFAAMPAESLYLGPVSDAKPPEQFAESDRERADSALTIRSTVALQDFVGRFLDLATLAATDAAMLIGMDEMANRPSNPA